MINRIKIFYTDDNTLKLLGELLSNKTSRAIIKILSEEECYTNQIADKLNESSATVLNHLKKLELLGIAKITNKPIKKKGIKHKHYKINVDIFISSFSKEETEKQGKLKKIFRDGVKFAAIGVASFISWLLVPNKPITDGWQLVSNDIIPNLTIPFLVIIIGLILFLIKKKRVSD